MEWWFQSPGCRSSGVWQLRLQAVREVISSTRDSQHESTEEYSFRRVLARHSNLRWPNDWFPSLFSLQYSWSLVSLFWRWCSINHILEHYFLACIFRYYCGHVVVKVYDERSAQRCATIATPPSFFATVGSVGSKIQTGPRVSQWLHAWCSQIQEMVTWKMFGVLVECYI